MSVYIDRKFLHLLSPKLERFAQKKQDLYNFRCPICGDSQTKKSKTRGYIFRKANDYFFMCHNCGASHTFYNFIKFVDPSLLQEYALERFKKGETGNHNYTKPKFDEFIKLCKNEFQHNKLNAQNYNKLRKFIIKNYTDVNIREIDAYLKDIKDINLEEQPILQKSSRRKRSDMSLVDNFIEALTGRNIVESRNPIYRVKLNKPELQLIYYDDNEGITLLDQIKSYLEKDISLLEVIKNNTDLSNIRDEMLGELNKVAYLFSLN
jgi:hypothetical protein